MPRRLLCVGNCSADHAALSRWLEEHFDIVVHAADTFEQALSAIRRQSPDLVLINRRFHADGREGVELIRRLKSDAHTAATPVMLISNFPEYQAQAVAAGAAPGFGKDQIRRPEGLERVTPFLA